MGAQNRSAPAVGGRQGLSGSRLAGANHPPENFQQPQRTGPGYGFEHIAEPMGRVLARITATIAPIPRWRRFHARHR